LQTFDSDGNKKYGEFVIGKGLIDGKPVHQSTKDRYLPYFQWAGGDFGQRKSFIS
jgi:hypothetical protein